MENKIKRGNKKASKNFNMYGDCIGKYVYSQKYKTSFCECIPTIN